MMPPKHRGALYSARNRVQRPADTLAYFDIKNWKIPGHPLFLARAAQGDKKDIRSRRIDVGDQPLHVILRNVSVGPPHNLYAGMPLAEDLNSPAADIFLGSVNEDSIALFRGNGTQPLHQVSAGNPSYWCAKQHTRRQHDAYTIRNQQNRVIKERP